MMKDRIQLALGYCSGRIWEYEEVLRLAQQNGYRMMSLTGYLQEGRPSKCIILRHDIDFRSPATRRMLDIEQKYSATASYYFRPSTMDMELMKLIESKGSEASLHFETLATWAEIHGIDSPAKLAASNWKTDCLDILVNEVRNLRTAGFPCRTIASHGHEMNYRINAANYYLTYQEDAYSKLDIDLEAYNKQFLAELDIYIIDGDRAVNRGWHYGTSPQEAIAEGKQRILLLTHPNHWQYSPTRAAYNMIRALYFGPRTVKAEFELE